MARVAAEIPTREPMIRIQASITSKYVLVSPLALNAPVQ
jgi:hypothetical protein